jgi:hypothetical protein
VLNEVSSSSSQSLVDGCEWTVKDADSDSYDAVQVTLALLAPFFVFGVMDGRMDAAQVCRLCCHGALQVELGCSKGKLDISYVVTLYPLSMATAVIVRNTGTKPVELTSAVLSHIKFDKRGGTAVEGLRGSPYCSHPPPPAGFALLTPAEAMKREDPGWFSGGGEEPRQGVWTVEEDMYTTLKKKVSRVYAAPPEERKKRIYNTAPSKFITIDQV